MPVPTQHHLEDSRNREHPDCIACGQGKLPGLGLEFAVCEDQGVRAEFPCARIYQGYPGLLHGGISSMLLDAAMTNCLFAHNISALTARMILRYLHPVEVDRPATVKAWLREYEPPLYVLEAEIEQNGRVLVRASAKFINREQ
ncbi:MAG: PaaI family thioesterase [Acidobacteriota bacterium]|jgi:acyl-coenzyme A thioesterase PaaI-like protein|nr:PaaI family thioesterase [Acidobacteriota bacterium]NLT32398.1 PaaI family thioesterase [Acidobacteriota bacterium]